MTKQFTLIVGIVTLLIAGAVWKSGADNPVVGDPLVLAPSGGVTGVYRNSAFGFSLTLPKGSAITQLEDTGDGSTTLLAQGDPQFQIYIVPFEEDLVVTARLLKQELPEMVVKDDKELSLSDDKAKALAFTSEDESFGPTREVWFVYAGHLYQAKSKVEAGKAMEESITTWKFD